jgi:hypothetical protein
VSHASRLRCFGAVALIVLPLEGCRAADPQAPPKLVTPGQRDAALVSARVWRPPAIPIGQANLGSNPAEEGWADTTDIDCRFALQKVGGTTPKFYCTLDSGDIVKVKYGPSNPELAGEVAATRLLHALGFPADRMYVTNSVRCWGCPPFPYVALQCIERTGATGPCTMGASEARAVIFPRAVVERPLKGRKIEASIDQGWSWFELDRLDPRRGGSTRAEVDALRLMAILLAHWDNKGPNQRLVCPEGQDRADGSCGAPLLMVQDLGATYGPLKSDLHNWRRQPMWEERAACRVSMKTLPFNGATFATHRISEEGRQFALKLLRPLTWSQLSALFTAAGMTRFDHVIGEAHDADAWVRAFMTKVDQIAAGGPCATAAELTARGE